MTSSIVERGNQIQATVLKVSCPESFLKLSGIEYFEQVYCMYPREYFKGKVFV